MTSKPYVVSPAEAGDLPEIVALVNSAYRGESSRAGWTTEADLLDGQRTDVESLAAELKPHCRILCLREKTGGPILASVFLELFKNEKGSGCYLGMLTVKPTSQTIGLGKYLLSAAEDFAKKAGAAWMTLGVIQLRETLIAWYERRGYHRTGATKPFPYGERRAGVPKRDNMHFVMFEKQI